MSTLVAQTLSNGTVSTSTANCIQGAAKAWVSFTGTGTVTIRASYNVSSITDNGTGDYTINFTNALPDANYSVVSTAGWPQRANSSINSWSNQTTTQTKVWNSNQTSNIAEDPPQVSVSIFD